MKKISHKHEITEVNTKNIKNNGYFYFWHWKDTQFGAFQCLFMS
ncbi:MAG TPA: hypothetical protein PLO45_00950 [Defluviitoga sp.]|nr:hypothetical protein [Defluviitoga sp.]